MVHSGKHIIDPETGLCEICDQGAIQEVRHGKQPGKQVYYSNHDDRLTYRSNDDEIPYIKDDYSYDIHDEPTRRYVRRPLHPGTSVRSRRVIYEQPIEEPRVVRRKIVRRELTPPEDDIIHHPPRPTRFYYVDKEGQMLPQKNNPPPEPPRRYIVQGRQSPLPGTRTVRVVRRHSQTLPVSEVRHSVPRRQIKSDTEIIEREQRMRRDDTYYHQSPPKLPEMFHIEAIYDNNRDLPLDSPIHRTYNSITPPPRMIIQGKQRKLDPVERNNQYEPEPTVVRRVYKKLPPGKYEPPDDEYIPNENHQRPVRKGGKNPPPPRQFVSSPELPIGNNRNRVPAKNPSIYYIRPAEAY